MGAALSDKIATVTIASGASVSDVIEATRCLITHINIPANLRSVTSIKFSKAPSKTGTYATLTNAPFGAGEALTDFTIALTASKSVPLPQDVFKGIGYFKITPNSAPSGGDLVFELSCVEAS